MTKYEFDNLIKPLVEIYDEIELDIIKDMLSRLLSYDDIQGTLKWYLEKLNDLKSFKKSSQKLIKNNKKNIEKVLKSIVEKAGTKVDDFDKLEEYFNKGLIKNNPSISRAELARQLDLSERQVRKMMDQLRADERLTRKGGKTGEWIIIDK